MEEVKNGEEITISFGRKKEKIAVIIPYSKYKKNIKRKLGLLENKASYKINKNFKFSDNNFLNS